MIQESLTVGDYKTPLEFKDDMELIFSNSMRYNTDRKSQVILRFSSTVTETLNNFCPYRFSQVCPDFPFRQNANLHSVSRFTVQICVADEKIYIRFLYRFAFWGKEMWTHLRKSRLTEIVGTFQLRMKINCWALPRFSTQWHVTLTRKHVDRMILNQGRIQDFVQGGRGWDE